MYLLYGGPPTRSLLVEMVMAEGEIEFEQRFIDIKKGQERSAEFLQINPAGWVPVLVTPEGEVIYETPAINLYLCERHALTQLAPETGDPRRARFLSALYYLTGELEHALKRYWYAETFGDGESDVDSIREAAVRHINDRCAVIDRRLSAAGPFHLGDRFSLADLTLAYWIGNVEELELSERFEAIRACCKKVAERDKLSPLFEKLKTW